MPPWRSWHYFHLICKDKPFSLVKNLYLLALASVLLALTSCKLDPNWDVEALAPIAQTTLTPGNLIGDSNLVAQPGGDLVLDYENTVFNFPVDSILKLPDSTYYYSFHAPFAFTIQPGFPLNVYNDYLLFNLTQVGLSEAYTEAGKLKISIKSWATQPTILQFEIPKAKKAGVPFSFTDNLAAAPAGSYSLYEREFDISSYAIDFSGDNSDQFNKLRMKIMATVAPDAQPFPVEANQELIEASISFEGIKPYFAKGRIHTRSLDISADTVKLPFMDMIQSGTVDLDEVDMTLTVENGFGVDARCHFSYITGINTRTGNQVALNHAVIGNDINLNTAMPTGSTPPFVPSSYPINISTSNSNFEAFAVNFPDRVAINGNFTVNPEGNLSAGNDFVYSTSGAKVKLKVTAPLAFSANNLLLAQTVAFNGESLKKNNPIRSGTLKVYAQNKFPFELGLKLSASDSVGTVLWSMAAEELMAAGIAEPDGRVYQPVSSVLTFALTADDFEYLKQCKNIRFEVRFHTLPTGQLMKIYQDYALNLKVVAQITAGL